MANKYVDNDNREENVINRVMKKSRVDKGSAIAILKSKDVLKQKKGKPGLKIKSKSSTKKGKK